MLLVRLGIIISLILVNCSFVFSAMIEGEVSPHKGDRNTEVTINYVINSTLTDARVKVYLNNYDSLSNGFDGNIDETIIDYFNVSPANISPISIKLSNFSSNFYRICLKLATNGKYYSDCDSGNQFLLIDDTPIINNIIEQARPVIQVSVEAPENVFASKEFFVNATVSNNGLGDAFIKVYSYVYNSSGKISEGAWDANKKEFFLGGGSSLRIKLNNTVNYQGKFTLKVRTPGYNDVTKEISVIPFPLERLFINEPVIINDSLRITVSNPGNYARNLTLNYYSFNESRIFNFTLESKRAKEFFVNKTQGNAYLLLFRDNELVDSLIFFTNSSPSAEINISGNNLLIKKENYAYYNSTNALEKDSVKLVSNSLNNSISDYFSENIGMEILLYPLILVLSLTALGVVIYKL